MIRHLEILKSFGITVALCAAWCVAVQSVQAQCWEESQKLLASDGTVGNWLGSSISIDGNVMAVGARQDDDSGDGSGSVYVYRHNGTDWVEEAKLLASDGVAYDEFGRSVSISGNVIVVGAATDGENSGSVYVFRYEGSSWIEEAKLLSSDWYYADRFGYTVSIDGDKIAIGAYGDGDNGYGSGSAYVFRHDGSGWVEEAKLLASDGAELDTFGFSISIDSNAIVVGADWDDDSGADSGSVYVFRYNGSGWAEEAKLLASDGDGGDWFGTAVSIAGNTIVVGADGDEDNGPFAGSAYVFQYNGSDWAEKAKLMASNGRESDLFGASVSIAGNAIVVGAYNDGGNGTDTGSAYVFRHDGSGQWVEETRLLASDGAVDERFGYSVSIDGDTIVVGVVFDDDNGNSSGSAYVYDLQCIPTLTITPDPLIVNQNGNFTATNMTPTTATFLAYSLHGTGSTYIPQLNITLNLSQPGQAGNTITSDSNGTAEWILHIPNAAAGRNVWFQACQYERKTNVIATSIQ